MKITVRFRGRELAYASQSGFEVLKHLVESIADVAKVVVGSEDGREAIWPSSPPRCTRKARRGGKNRAGRPPHRRYRREGCARRRPRQRRKTGG